MENILIYLLLSVVDRSGAAKIKLHLLSDERTEQVQRSKLKSPTRENSGY